MPVLAVPAENISRPTGTLTTADSLLRIEWGWEEFGWLYLQLVLQEISKTVGIGALLAMELVNGWQVACPVYIVWKDLWLEDFVTLNATSTPSGAFQFHRQMLWVALFPLNRKRGMIQSVLCTAHGRGSEVNYNILQQSKNDMGVRSWIIRGKQSWLIFSLF